MKNISKIEIICALIPVALGCLTLLSFNTKVHAADLDVDLQPVSMQIVQISSDSFRIYQNQSALCLTPERYNNGSKVVTKKACTSSNTIWARLSNGLIKHQESKYCLGQKQDTYILTRCGRNASQLTSKYCLGQKQDTYILTRCGRNASQLTSNTSLLTLAPLPIQTQVYASK